jgi:hypothetical protein
MTCAPIATESLDSFSDRLRVATRITAGVVRVSRVVGFYNLGVQVRRASAPLMVSSRTPR